MSLMAAIGIAGVLSIYVPALQGPDSEERSIAVDALVREGALHVGEVADLLWRAGWRAREGVMDALEKIGPSSLPELMRVVRTHPRTDARRLAVLKVGKIGAFAARDSLEDLLDTMDRDIVLKALGNLGDASSRSAVRLFLQDPQVDVRRRALIALGKASGDREVDTILDGLSDSHHSVRYAAKGLLTKIGEPACRTLLWRLNGLKDIARFQAICILGELRYSPALPELERQLKESVWWIRAAAAQALGQLEEGEVRRILQASLLDEQHPVVLARIALALRGRTR